MSVTAGALALVALYATDASAQLTPTLSATADGTTVTIQWTAVPGATGYVIRVTGPLSGDVTLPAAPQTIRVGPVPPGTYTLQIAGTAGSNIGPASNVATVTIGGGGTPPPPGGCQQPAAPVISTNVAGGTVQVSWNAVPGAQGYRVEFSRFAGATEAQVTTAATSYSQYIPAVGTYFVRVVAGNACGLATSQEASFTISNLNSGSGPRTADPPPGQIIPRASLGYAAGVINQVAAQFNGELQNSCREQGGNNTFLFRVVQRLRQIDSRWGLNDKRGQAGDMSQDIISFNPTDRPDNGESQVYLWDIMSNHCGSGRVDPNFADVTDATWPQGLAGNPACGTRYCARWTIDAYLRAGFPPDARQ